MAVQAALVVLIILNERAWQPENRMLLVSPAWLYQAILILIISFAIFFILQALRGSSAKLLHSSMPVWYYQVVVFHQELPGELAAVRPAKTQKELQLNTIRIMRAVNTTDTRPAQCKPYISEPLVTAGARSESSTLFLTLSLSLCLLS